MASGANLLPLSYIIFIGFSWETSLMKSQIKSGGTEVGLVVVSVPSINFVGFSSFLISNLGGGFSLVFSLASDDQMN